MHDIISNTVSFFNFQKIAKNDKDMESLPQTQF